MAKSKTKAKKKTTAKKQPPPPAKKQPPRAPKVVDGNTELNAIRAAVDKWANYRARAFAFGDRDTERDRSLYREAKEAVSFFTEKFAPRNSSGMRKRCYNECGHLNHALDSQAPGDALIRVKILAACWSERE